MTRKIASTLENTNLHHLTKAMFIRNGAHLKELRDTKVGLKAPVSFYIQLPRPFSASLADFYYFFFVIGLNLKGSSMKINKS